MSPSIEISHPLSQKCRISNRLLGRVFVLFLKQVVEGYEAAAS